ncbi:MAG: sulfotransferase [Rhodothermales bacterium]
MLDVELFYIVGVGRSGTTLLMSMLNAHPEIGTPPETHFVTSHISGRRPVSIAECREVLSADQRLDRLGLDFDDVFRSGHRDEAKLSMETVYFRILSRWKERHGVRLVGDKAPRYVEFLPLLKSIAPRAKVIHMIRDPREVFLSRTRAAWSAGRREWTHLLAYTVQYSVGRADGAKLFGDNYYEVLYEHLISRPEEELKRLCTFLGVAYDSSMLQFSSSAAEIIAEDEWAWKSEAAGPLLKKNTEKWRSQLSQRQVARIETACRKPFTDGLYERSGLTPRSMDLVMAFFVSSTAVLYRALRQLKMFWRLRRSS